MDERQKQLVAAAEAMRTWIHAQRAIWTTGYPQSLRQPQPQLAGAAAVAAAPAVAAFPEAFLSEPVPAPVETWTDREIKKSWWEGLTERITSTVQGTTTFVQTSWRMLAVIAGIVLLVGAVRVAWPGVKTKVSSNLATSRDAGKSTTESASPAPATGDRGVNAAGSVAAVAKGSGRLHVESSPAGAHVLIDGTDRGVTPLTVDGLASGSHKVVVRAEDGSVQRNVSIAANETVQLSESIYSGWLHVTAPFEVQLSEGRKSITLDDSNQVLLAPGPHDVRFENRAVGLREVRHIEIKPGETTALSLETPMSHLTVTASEPATVSIDGAQVGETPLTDHAIPVGTRDVTVTSASGVVRHQMITVKVEPAKLDIDFSKP
jgi:PEGA domain-containing protein